MAELTYKIKLQKEPEGGYTVMVPSLPGCITYGEDVDDAIKWQKKQLNYILRAFAAHGEEIPTETNTLEYSLTFSPDIKQSA